MERRAPSFDPSRFDKVLTISPDNVNRARPRSHSDIVRGDQYVEFSDEHYSDEFCYSDNSNDSDNNNNASGAVCGGNSENTINIADGDNARSDDSSDYIVYETNDNTADSSGECSESDNIMSNEKSRDDSSDSSDCSDYSESSCDCEECRKCATSSEHEYIDDLTNWELCALCAILDPDMYPGDRCGEDITNRILEKAANCAILGGQEIEELTAQEIWSVIQIQEGIEPDCMQSVVNRALLKIDSGNCTLIGESEETPELPQDNEEPTAVHAPPQTSLWGSLANWIWAPQPPANDNTSDSTDDNSVDTDADYPEESRSFVDLVELTCTMM